MLFKKGDVVQWTSSGSIRNAKKQGQVVAIVPAGVEPAAIFALDSTAQRVITEQRLRALGVDPEKYNYSPLGGGTARDHESYLVAVVNRGPRGGPAKPKLYWPRVRGLRRAEPYGDGR